MYNLKRGKGTYKGIIGECLFKLTRRYLILTKFFNKNKYFLQFGDRFLEQQIQFLNENWHSIDAIEFIYEKGMRKTTLFEIKTLNDFYFEKLNGINRIPKFTKNTLDMYHLALDKGFDVKVAVIWLKNSWNYDVEIIDFDKCKHIVDDTKLYDKNLI
jgi:hypothetical protein